MIANTSSEVLQFQVNYQVVYTEQNSESGTNSRMAYVSINNNDISYNNNYGIPLPLIPVIFHVCTLILIPVIIHQLFAIITLITSSH